MFSVVDSQMPAEDSESFGLVSIDGTRVLGAFPSDSLDLFDSSEPRTHDLIDFLGSIPFYFVLAVFFGGKVKDLTNRISYMHDLTTNQPSVLQAFQVSRRCLDLTLIGILGAWSCSLTFFR